MTTSRLHSTLTQYRQQLLRNESRAAQTLEHAYAHTLAAIQPQLEKLYREIAEKQAQGEQVPLSWLYEARRLESLKKMLANQISHYGTIAQLVTGQLQHLGAALGMQAAQALLHDTVPPGVMWSFGVPHPGAIANLVGATQKGSPLADLFAGFGDEAAKGVGDALISGVALGHGPRQIASQVQQALDVPRWRALTIVRTEALRSYRGANLATFQANRDVVKQWRWTAAKDVRTCPACLAMDGSLHSVDEDMAAHVNCRCVMSPVTADWSDILGPLGIDTGNIPDTRPDIQSGSDWLDAQDERVQRQILGAKYDGWANGDFTLSDIVAYDHDPDWGKSIKEKSLKALVK